MKIEATILTFALIFSFVSCGNKSGFETEHQEIIIKQNIGGFLICNSTYDADFHSWEYKIVYKYKDLNNNVYDIGTGEYEGEEWKKDEQLVSFGKWTIFHTSSSRDADKLIIGDLKTNIWTEYIISPATIEWDKVWLNQNLDVAPDNFDSVSKIKTINSNGQFSVLYKFAKRNRLFSFMTNKRIINYQINSITGKPEMKSVTIS